MTPSSYQRSLTSLRKRFSYCKRMLPGGDSFSIWTRPRSLHCARKRGSSSWGALRCPGLSQS
eukprot:754206-Alexandrium_andersonii.AAC.1